MDLLSELRALYMSKHYGACSSQRVFNIFLALFTFLGYRIMTADAMNAYACAPPPKETLYAHVDDQYSQLHQGLY